MDDEEILFSRMIFAMPELEYDEDYIELGRKLGYYTDEQARIYKRLGKEAKRAGKLSKKLSGKDLKERIMILMPEIMSVSTVNFLRKVKIGGKPVLSDKEATALRAVLSGSKAIRPLFAKEATIMQRIEAVFGAAAQNNWINLIRDIDNERLEAIRHWFLKDSQGRDIGRLSPEEAQFVRDLLEKSVKRAQVARSGLSSARIIGSAVTGAKAQSTVWGGMTVLFDEIFGYKNGDKMLKNAIRAGVISQADYGRIRALEKIGFDMWRKVVHAKDYDSWYARTLIVSEGLLSPNMLKALEKEGFVPPIIARRIAPLLKHIRSRTREQFSQYMKEARFRVVPGESPIKTFARLSRYTDKEILLLLEEAAQDTKRMISAAAGTKKFGESSRVAQQRLAMVGIHEKMREVWEDVGTLTIFGEKEAAQAGLMAGEQLLSVYASTTKHVGLVNLRKAARAGIDAYISREENLKQLSKTVYKNAALSTGLVEREIQKALIRGLSAKELAEAVAPLIRPSVPGGVSYAAMRLARTEINNAFHFSQIRYTREMPWVEGYKWNLSGSHPSGQRCVCEDMAQKNHDGIGRGVYKKANVPGKPHPHCLCYLTNAEVDNKTFYKRLNSGAYDLYIAGAVNNPIDEYKFAKTTRDSSMDWLQGATSSMVKSNLLGVISGIA